jgi:hypothetical protein
MLALHRRVGPQLHAARSGVDTPTVPNGSNSSIHSRIVLDVCIRGWVEHTTSFYPHADRHEAV